MSVDMSQRYKQQVLCWVAWIPMSDRNSLQLTTFLVGNIIPTRRVPVEGKSSECLICMKYRIIIFIIISLGQKELSYIVNTSRTHACARTRAHACASTHTRTHACTHARTHTAIAPVQVSAIRWHPTTTARSACIHSR